jgi:ABC-type antimicrobial peptide transport system permease subunit
MMGFEEPVGQRMIRGEDEYEIIGVVRDFNFQHLSQEISPLVIINGKSGRHLNVKIHPGAEAEVREIGGMLSETFGKPVPFTFIDEMYDRLYRGESQILAAVLFFTLLCILLSSLGLIGMVSLSASARTREIAVRKVFGAETGSIMIRQITGILRMFLPGMAIGCVLAWFIMKNWMEMYAHRIGLEGWVFIAGPLLILIVALLSISFQTWNSSRRSPARSLRHL